MTIAVADAGPLRAGEVEMTLSAECRRSRERITEYLEGALTSRENGVFEEHLRACVRCQEALSQLRATVAASHQLPPEPVPSRIRSALLRALRERKEP